MVTLFNELLYKPLVNALIFLYETAAFYDLGVAIILLTILIRLVMFPVFYKTAKHQRITQKLQPHLKKIQETHKGDKTAQTQATLDLYKAHGINPLTPLFLVLIQLPILIALYQVFSGGLSEETLKYLYSFVSRPEVINSTFFGLDLHASSWPLVLLAAAAQYIQGKMALIKREPNSTPTQAEKIGEQMVYIGPILTLVILWSFPAAIGLYWLVTTLFSIGQQVLVNKHIAAETKGN